jgi:hypothetical protein
MVLQRGRGTGGRLEGIEAVTTELDIYRTTAVLIHEHGEDAMLERGNVEGSAVWLCLLHAIEEIQRVERRDGEAAH